MDGEPVLEDLDGLAREAAIDLGGGECNGRSRSRRSVLLFDGGGRTWVPRGCRRLIHQSEATDSVQGHTACAISLVATLTDALALITIGLAVVARGGWHIKRVFKGHDGIAGRGCFPEAKRVVLFVVLQGPAGKVIIGGILQGQIQVVGMASTWHGGWVDAVPVDE